MLRNYVLLRLAQAPFLILIILVFNFALIHAAPGDPISIFIGQSGASPEFVQSLRAKYGLDRPIALQLYEYIKHAFQLDLGFSIRYQADVLQLILRRLPATLLLSGSGLVISSLIGIVLGVVAARRSGSLADRISTMVAVGAQSMPVFWLGHLLLLAFALKLPWFPLQGMQSITSPGHGFTRLTDIAWHMVLPTLAYSSLYLALVFRLTRTKMQEAIGQDFILTARAKGLPESQVVYQHALPNAFLPVFTVIAYNFGLLLAGSTLVERVFGWPGLGLLMFDATAARDFSLLLGIFAVVSTVVIVVAVATDILYAVLDPRVVLS